MGKHPSHLEREQSAVPQSPGAHDWRRSGAFGLTVAGAALGLLSLQPQAPRLIWNFTQSLPVGLYGIVHIAPAKGDLIAIAPTGAMRETLDAYSVLPAGRVLLKQLVAARGDTVCRTEMSIIVNGVIAATARLKSSDGRALPAWSGCRRLAEAEVLVLAPHAFSFDGRYFGPTDAHQIIGVARPLLTFSQQGAS